MKSETFWKQRVCRIETIYLQRDMHACIPDKRKTSVKNNNANPHSVCIYKLLFLLCNTIKESTSFLLTKRSDIGVLSEAGRCCSKASTMQFAIIVAKIMYSNGVTVLRKSCEN